MSTALAVYSDSTLVGRLERDGDDLHFAYARSWLASAGAFAISVSLPLDGRFDARHAARFFGNLLPEAGVRALLCRRLGISEGNDFALLAAIGGECAGALTLLPEGVDPKEHTDEYEVLPPARLRELTASFEALPIVDGSGRARLSLAGAQDKLPVRLEGRRILLPLGNSRSSHILKLPNRSFRHLPANEALVTDLARRVGLPAVATEWRAIGEEGVCIVERYDRVVGEDGIQRLHQEDFCQAMGLAASTKYEEEGGPSLARSVALLRDQSVVPLEDVDTLLRWIAFNAIAGNADGHGKNLSLVARDGLRLAPLYDLVCTRAYDRLERRLATSIGGERDPDRLRTQHLDACARDLDVKPRLVRATFEVVAEAILETIDAITSDSPVRERIVPLVKKQARRWLRELRPKAK